MTSSSTFIAFLGATALARTPSKLIDMLIAQGVSESIIDNQLTIVKGDIADILTIKFALFSTKTHTIASQIISGVGGTPQMRMSLFKPMTIDNPEICATTTQNII